MVTIFRVFSFPRLPPFTQMYHDIMLALEAAGKDDSAITVLTGETFSEISS